MLDDETYKSLRNEIDNNHKNIEINIPDEEYYQLPTIDMNQTEQVKIDSIMKQMTTLGFLALENVSEFDEVIHYYWIKWFFNHTDEEKKNIIRKPYNKDSQNIYRGLAPFLDDDPSYKEIYDFGQNIQLVSEKEKQYPLHEQNPYFEGEQSQEFKDYIHKYYEIFKNLGGEIMQYIAQGLGQPKNYFDKFLNNDSLSTGRLIHYKNRVNQNESQLQDKEIKLTTPPHTDSSILTLLCTFNQAGLQVDVDGQFKTIKPQPNVLIINLGDMISRMSGFKLKATTHQVLDIGCVRYSSPYFLEPNYQANIPINLFEEENSTSFVYGDYLISKMTQKYGEWKDLLQDLEIQGFQIDDKKKDCEQWLLV